MNESTLKKEDLTTHATQSDDLVLTFKKRMLQWANPVEYVNNMYGCHPGDGDNDYFHEVFSE